MKKNAIVDTSAILFGLEYRKDVFESLATELPEYAPIVSRGIMRELARFSSIKGKRGAMARTALLALKAKKVRVYNINVNADKWIVRHASSFSGTVVISNDSELIRILCRRRVPCFRISKSGMLKRSFK